MYFKRSINNWNINCSNNFSIFLNNNNNNDNNNNNNNNNKEETK